MSASTSTSIIGSILREVTLSGGAALQGGTPSLVRPLFGELAEAATYHGVNNALYLATRSMNLDPEDLNGLHQLHSSSVRRHMLATLLLRRLSTAFDVAGIPWLTFKGPVLAESLYPRFDLRTYADLDLLVSPAAFEDAVMIVEGIGGEIYEKNWTSMNRTMRGELNIVTPPGVAVDLHWSLVFDKNRREQFTFITADILARRRAFTLSDGTTVWTLDDIDNVALVGHHGCLSGGHKLTYARDLQLALETVDHDQLIERLRSLKAILPFFTMVARARHLLGCPLPIRRPSDRGLRAWPAIFSAYDQRQDPLDRPSRHHTLSIFARSTRPTVQQSLIASARSTAVQLRDAYEFRSHNNSPPPKQLLIPTGGRVARRRFMRAVSTEN